MDVADFHFDLPDELIAQDAAPRGTSRLLVLDRRTGAVRHASIADLPSLLRPGDLLVVNNTRVFAARLLGHRVPSGGAVECLLLEPPRTDGGAGLQAGRFGSDVNDRTPTAGPPSTGLRPGKASTSDHSAEPRTANRESPFGGAQGDPEALEGSRIAPALMHPGQKLKPGARVRFEGPAGVLMAEVVDRHFYGRRTIRLWSESGDDVDTLIDALGHVPLPPYIKRDDTIADRDRYQTVFARVRGSVAAPTAGLHFDDALMSALDARGIERAEITLHVGYGTFKPVRVERVEDHVVDPEHYEISAEAAKAIERARDEGRRVIAVGTTTTRALEDAAARNGRVIAGAGTASLFIYPGHRFKVIDGLLTNFHLPSSSLLMLVAAFGGREHVLAAYREAVERRYRFYSYGDAMLLL